MRAVIAFRVRRQRFPFKGSAESHQVLNGCERNLGAATCDFRLRRLELAALVVIASVVFNGDQTADLAIGDSLSRREDQIANRGDQHLAFRVFKYAAQIGARERDLQRNGNALHIHGRKFESQVVDTAKPKNADEFIDLHAVQGMILQSTGQGFHVGSDLAVCPRRVAG
jgi:hypothetical protein